jgi:hypothetical protein
MTIESSPERAAAEAASYLTLEGQVVDLGGLNQEERAFFVRCYAACRRASMDWSDFANLVAGNENPLVRAAGGRITRAVWDHPLFQAVRDLEDRYGIAQGRLASEPEYDLDRDPIEDSWIPSVEAAERKGVSLAGLHLAIKRGAVIAHAAKPGGTRLVVSVNSLERWKPSAAYQAAGRRRAGHIEVSTTGRNRNGATTTVVSA